MSSDLGAIGATPASVPVPKPTRVEASSEAEAPAAPVAAAEPAAEAERPRLDAKELQDRLNEAVERMNEHMRKNNYNLAFSVDREVDKVVIKVTNMETGDVVRQIPNEAALRIAHGIEDMRGLLRDEKI